MAELPLVQAAMVLGVSVDTLRRRIHAQQVSARQDERGRWLVEVLDPEESTDPLEMDAAAPTRDGELEALHELVAVLRDQLDARTREVSELHVLLQRAQQQALPAPHEDLDEGPGAAETPAEPPPSSATDLDPATLELMHQQAEAMAELSREVTTLRLQLAKVEGEQERSAQAAREQPPADAPAAPMQSVRKPWYRRLFG
jgi:hypothetical protein